MRESIVCIGKTAENAYCFPETGAEIYSYEELCYYLSSHMICYLYTLPEEELLYYIRDELGLEKLYRQLAKLTDVDRDQMKYFSALFREGNYYSEEEIRQILDEYRNLKNAPYPMQCKWLGDEYLNAGRAAMAVHSYREALKQDSLDKEESGAVYHNMGIAFARLFRFGDAKIHFVKAYQFRGDEESLYYYFCINALKGGVDKARDEMETFQLSELLLESFSERFSDSMDAFFHSEAFSKKKKIQFLLENGKEDEGQAMYRKTVLEYQKKFRQELETEEPLMTANVPALQEI